MRWLRHLFAPSSARMFPAAALEHIAAAIAQALSDCMHSCMASMSMVISPMSIDFIIAIVSIWISRVLVVTE